MIDLEVIWHWYKPIAGWAGGAIFTLLIIISVVVFTRRLLGKAKCRKCGKIDVVLFISNRCRHCNWYN